MQPPPSLLMLEQHCLGLCLRHKASSLQALEIVEQLLQAYPAGISIRSSNGQGALPIETAVGRGGCAPRAALAGSWLGTGSGH
jgi:outer membrane receptor for Fe3+-dicitrate